MKRFFYAFLLFFVFSFSYSQVFWTETFGIGCSQNQTLTPANPVAASANGNWTASYLGTYVPTTGSDEFFISATEAGMGSGVCGNGCISNGTLTNRTLHIGNSSSNTTFLCTTGDCGAIYNAGVSSDLRAESPVINCTGQNGIILSFEYLENGQGTSDDAEVYYSIAAGPWLLLGNMGKTLCGNAACTVTNAACTGLNQGVWSTYTVNMPAAANNQANVRIGFRWVNNGDNAGTDPSFAVDNITMKVLATFTPNFAITSPQCQGATITTTCAVTPATTAITGYTWSSNPAGPTFGAPNASVTSITYPSTGTFTISVTASAGGTNVATVDQTVVVTATPNIVASTNPATICVGGTATLTAVGGTSYTWNPGALSGPSVSVNPVATTVYTVIGSNGTCTNVSTTTVNIAPSLNLTVTATNATVCPGSTVALTAAGATNYTWSPGSSLSSTSGANVTASPTVSTVYTVLGASGTCTGVATINIGVTASLPISVSGFPSLTTACPGGSSTLTATGAGTSGQYTWSPAAYLSATTGSAVVTTPSVNTAYTVVGLDPLTGCTGTTNVNVVVGAPLSVSVSPTSATTCVGSGGVTLSAFGATSYIWSPSSSLSSGFGPVVVATPSTSTTYTVLGSTGTCTAQAVVTVSVTSPPTLTVTPTNTTICFGSSYTYSATGAGTAGTYTWTPAFTLSCFNCPNPVASPTTTTTYTVVGQTALGCLSLPRVVTLTVVPIPTATVSLQTNTLGIITNTICGNQSATLSVATSTPPIGMSYSYTWSPTTNIITSPNSATVLAVPGMSVCLNDYLRTYTCTVSYGTLQGCKSKPDTATVRVINCFPPVANFTTAVKNDTICTKGCVTFINTSCGGKPQSVKWYSPGGNPDTTSAPYPVICYNVPGDYTVSLAVTNAYGKDSTVKTKFIHVVDTPNTKGVRDTCIRFGQSVQLLGTQAIYYTWSPGSSLSCSTCANPVASPTVTTNYIVTGYNSSKCKYNDTLRVCVLDDCGTMYVPNAFSPNGDGINDVLYVRGKCLANFTFQIFNRWGEKVFESSDINFGWDGTFNSEPMNTGVFVYRLQGTTYNNDPFSMKGNITLIR